MWGKFNFTSPVPAHLHVKPGQCNKFRFRKVTQLDEKAVRAWMCTHARIMQTYVQDKRITFPLS